MSNLNRHVKSDKIKWIATAVALFLISLTIVGVCLQAFGKGKQKPSEWFQKPDKQIEQVDGDKTDGTDKNADSSADNADDKTVTE